jgi:hypothetical protein
MNNLKFFRRETFEESRNRRFLCIQRAAISAPIDEDINHMSLNILPGESVAVEIGNQLVTIKSSLNGAPMVQILTKPVWVR